MSLENEVEIEKANPTSFFIEPLEANLTKRKIDSSKPLKKIASQKS